MTFKKYFTVEEANSLIPHLLKTVPEIQSLSQTLSKKFPDVKKAWKKANENGGSAEGPEYLVFALKFNSLLNDLKSKGCVMKGIDQGLIDFPAMREGKEVFLCWKNPETKITHWHDLDSGFAGRQEL